MSAIGDVILTLPVVEALGERFPEAEIDYLVKSEYAEILAGHPRLNDLIVFDKSKGFAEYRQLVKRARKRRYDLIVDLHSNPRSMYLRLFAAPAMSRVYRKRVAERLLLKWFRWDLLHDAPPVADRYFTALEDFGIVRDGRRPRIFIPAEDKEKADKTLAAAGVPEGADILALAPGASYNTKKWPASHFARAALELCPPSRTVVLLGGPGDRRETDEVKTTLAESGTRAADLSGRMTLMGSAAVISRSSLLLTNDSGLMHVADALDKPLVAVFGPTSRELGFFPLGPGSRVAQVEGLECRPCSLHGDARCPLGHHRCMKELGPESVAALAREAMGNAHA